MQLNYRGSTSRVHLKKCLKHQRVIFTFDVHGNNRVRISIKVNTFSNNVSPPLVRQLTGPHVSEVRQVDVINERDYKLNMWHTHPSSSLGLKKISSRLRGRKPVIIGRAFKRCCLLARVSAKITRDYKSN